MIHEIPVIWIDCDHKGCAATTHEHDNEQDAIDQAKNNGWFVDYDNQVFLCIEHRGEKKMEHRFTKQKAAEARELFKELFGAIPKKRIAEYFGHANDIDLFLLAAEQNAPDDSKTGSKKT